jgi:hypothetical protein
VSALIGWAVSLAILADAPATSICATRALRAERTRMAKAAFKGVELYSWPARDGFRFSLLWGTNRTKTTAEIRSEACALVSVDALKDVLVRLAPGEHVVWSHRGCPKNRCAYPPNDVVEAVLRHARSAGVVLDRPDGRSPD